MKLVENNKLKEIILERLEKLDMKPAELIKDANERGQNITPSAFSKYKQGKKGGITDDQALWISTRLNIPIKLVIGEQKIVGGKIINVLPPFNELEALKRLSKIFGKNG